MKEKALAKASGTVRSRHSAMRGRRRGSRHNRPGRRGRWALSSAERVTRRWRRYREDHGRAAHALLRCTLFRSPHDPALPQRGGATRARLPNSAASGSLSRSEPTASLRVSSGEARGPRSCPRPGRCRRGPQIRAGRASFVRLGSVQSRVILLVPRVLDDLTSGKIAIAVAYAAGSDDAAMGRHALGVVSAEMGVDTMIGPATRSAVTRSHAGVG